MKMHKAIINNWNSVVQNSDTVFVLGDLGFCGIEKLRELLSQLYGNIVLVQGNHDPDKIAYKLVEEGLITRVVKMIDIVIEGDEECPNQALTLCHFPNDLIGIIKNVVRG